MENGNGRVWLAPVIITLLGTLVFAGWYGSNQLGTHEKLPSHPVIGQQFKDMTGHFERRFDRLESRQTVMQHDVTEVLRRLPK